MGVTTLIRFMVPSSSGLGHHPLKVEARVRIPLGLRFSSTRRRRTKEVPTSLLWSRVRIVAEAAVHHTSKVSKLLLHVNCERGAVVIDTCRRTYAPLLWVVTAGAGTSEGTV